MLALGGGPVWTNHYDYASFSAVAADGSGNVIATGYANSDFVTIKSSNAGARLWTNFYNGSGTIAIAVDNIGNVVVTGRSPSSGASGYATIKYSGAGVPIWTNRYHGPNPNAADTPRALGVDSSGNVFVAGGSANDTSSSAISHDYATVAYSAAGVPLWTNRYHGPAANTDDEATAVAADGSGNVFVTGHSVGSFFPPGYETIKYSGAGVPLWTNRYYGTNNNGAVPQAMTLDGSGNVLVTGFAIINGTESDYAIVKYSGAGVALWTNRYVGPGHSSDSPTAIATDGSDNVIVTGGSVNSGSNSDYATIKYSSAGAPLWVNRYNGPANGNDSASRIAVDSSGDVFVTGTSTGSSASLDFLTVAYSPTGVPLWTNRYNGLQNAFGGASAIAVDNVGNVFLAGTSQSATTNVNVIIKYTSSMPAPHLGFQQLNERLILSWSNSSFSLQSAPGLSATFTNISGATSPFTNPAAPQQFFRLISNY
jgi:hypothetical protein